MTTRQGRPRPGDIDHVIATVAVTVLTATTAIAMSRVFEGWAFLPALALMALAVHAVCMALRVARVPGIVAIPLTLVVIAEILAVMFYRETLTLFLPTSETLELFRIDLRLVWSQFPTAVAPVPSEGGFLLAAALGIGLVALFSDAFAFRAFGRAETAVPAGVLFVFTAALGTDRNRVVLAVAWFATAMVVVAVMRALHGGSGESWLGRRRRAVGAALPAAFASALVAALLAGVIGPLLPGAGAEPLLETRQTQSDVTQVLSPLVDIRSRLVNRSNTEMFTVGAALGRYWRVTGLTEFDGETWTLPDAQLVRAGDALNSPTPWTRVLQQQVTISRLGGQLLPAAFAPISVGLPDLLWLGITDTLLLDDGSLQTGQTYAVSSDVGVPPVDVLRSASVSSPPSAELLDLPADLPGEVGQLAREVTAGAPTPYDAARQLQDWFRQNFVYDLTVQRGHSDDAISAFLRLRRGYCEQFAGTFAVMARSLGLPSRVAVGFTQGELRSDGRYRVLGRHAHAWPEVWFDTLGWVAFEPTPGRGAPGSEEVTGAAPSQSNADEGGIGDGGGAAAPTTTIAPVLPTIEPDRGDGASTQAVTTTTLATIGTMTESGDGPGTAGWIVLGLATIAGWGFAMPHVVRRFTRAGSTPSEQVISAWHGAIGTLTLAGVPAPVGVTPLEYARAVEDHLAVDQRSLDELARFVTRAVYSPAGVGEPTAMRAAVLRKALDQSANEAMPWHLRLWSRFDPRVARRRLVGVRPVRHRRA